MKRTALLTVFLAFNVSVLCGQTAYDALMLSENNYEGTARSVAMGNAFTALGGDLGAVSINPAGSAVANYSQVTVTPGLTISSATSSGVSPYLDGELPYFERAYKSNRTGFCLPNIGFTMNFDTGNKYGIKNVSAGFVVNQTADYTGNVFAAGTNETTSFAGQMAYEASIEGYTGLDAEDAYDNYPWKLVTGYQSVMFDPYKDFYVAATEKVFDDNTAFTAGKLEQTYGRNTSGRKYEYLINASMNISDFIYLGCNIGINSLSYSYSEYFKESAVNSQDFLIEYEDEEGNIVESKYFNSLKYNSSYSFSGLGVFAKFGIIATPTSWLRVGATIQTPVLMKIDESWQDEGETSFSGPDAKRYSAESPRGENSWTFRSPLKASIGAALTFGKKGLVSADYEFCNYGNIRYRTSQWTDREVLEEINDEIKGAYGFSHNLRIGGEYKPLPFFSIRAGYGLKNSAEKAAETFTHQASFGLGFSTNGSFFADIACRSTFIPKEYFMPYQDYVFKVDAEGNEIVDPNYYAPEIRISSALVKVVLTLGFRF